MNVVHTIMVVANSSQRMIIEADLPKLACFPAASIDRGRRLKLNTLHRSGDGQRIARIDDGMPVIGKEDPGSQEESMLLAGQLNRLGEYLEITRS